MGESLSEEGGGTTDKMGKDTALLAAVDNFKKAALGRLRNGSYVATILDQETSNRLLHLAGRHDAVECARLLLDGEYGITPSSVDARDQLTRTPLHFAAEAHSKRCIQLLLSVSRNARTDARLLDGTRLVALEVALMSRRVHVDWSPDNSVEDLLAYLQKKDLNAVRFLVENTREVGEVAYRYAMEGRVAALAMLLLVVEERISGMVSVVIDGIRTKRSIYNSVVDEVQPIGEASARDGNEMWRKALLCEIQLLNHVEATSWRDRKVDRRSLPPLLRAAKAGDMNVTKMLLMGDVDVNETDPEGNTALHWCLSSSSSTQEPRIVLLLLKNGARVFQGHKLGLTPVHSAAAKGNYMALQSLLLHAQDCVDTPSKTKETPIFLAVIYGSLSCVRLLLHYGANPKAQNLRKQRPTYVATSQDMPFLLNSANVVPMNHGSTEKNHVMKKERYKELLDDDFDDYDHEDYCESFLVPKASLGQRDFRSSNLSDQGAKSKSYSALKEGPKLSQTSREEASSLSFTKMAMFSLLVLLLAISQAKASCDKAAAWGIAVQCLDNDPSAKSCCKTIMTSINGSVTCLCHISITNVMSDAGMMVDEPLNMSLQCGALPSSTVLPHDCLLPAPPAGAMEGLPPSPPAAASLEPPPSPPPTVELPPPTPPTSLEVPPPSPPATVELPPPTPTASLGVPPRPPPAGTRHLPASTSDYGRVAGGGGAAVACSRAYRVR